MSQNRSLVSILAFALFVCCGVSVGQVPWSGVLDPARATDWSGAGAGTIPNRTTYCSTTACNTLCGTPQSDNTCHGGTVTTTTITNAVNSASSGQVVRIPDGSFSLGGVTVGVNNISLRGAGADKTLLTLSGSSAGCNGFSAFFCIWNSDGNWWGGPDNGPTTWTATSYAQGQTTITLSSHPNLLVGTLVTLVQADDTSDTGIGWINCGSASSSCSQQGASNSQWNGWTEAQTVRVTACGTSTPGASCTSSTVTFTPGLRAPNWTSSKTPKAWWPRSTPITGVGIENLSFDCSGQSVNCINFWGAQGSWYIGNRSKSIGYNHVILNISSHITVQNSYMYGGSGSSEGYGVNIGNGSADNLIVNNICNHNADCMVSEGGDSGSVFAYNYSTDDFFGPGPFQMGFMTHSAGNHMELWEGNDTPDIQNDIIHGPSNAGTYFRNHLTGLDTATSTGTKTQGTVTANIGAKNRYYNVVGNVLGTAGHHTHYSDEAPNTTSCGTGEENVSIYLLGWSDQWGGAFSTACGAGTPNIQNDLATVSTLMRWGNWDVVNSSSVNSSNDDTGIRWVKAEDGSAANTYPALSNPSQTLPASFFQGSATPSWWQFPSGTPSPYPPIGPDVTNGNVIGSGGHVYYNPAANCYLNVMGGKTDGTSGWLTFNANTCYGSTSTSGGPVQPPTGLHATVL